MRGPHRELIEEAKKERLAAKKAAPSKPAGKKAGRPPGTGKVSVRDEKNWRARAATLRAIAGDMVVEHTKLRLQKLAAACDERAARAAKPKTSK